MLANKRLTARITGHVQDKLQMAADLVGATVNQFVVQAALEKAEKVIESESTIVLTRRESLRLLCSKHRMQVTSPFSTHKAKIPA